MRGTPDYNNPEYTFFSVDTPNSDLFAERLGFSRLDNRGRILYMDDFRNGLIKWDLSSDSGGINPTHYFINGKSIGYYGAVKLDPIGNGGLSILTKKLLLPVSKRVGYEIGVYPVSNFGAMTLSFQHCFSTGAGKDAVLVIEQQTGKVKIDAVGGMQTIVIPANVSYFVDRWIAVKLVADFELGIFTRLMLGNTQYDLSAYSMNGGFTGQSGASFFELGCSGIDATYKEEIYLGYVIISGDEP